MPELPEVETLRRSLLARLPGRRIETVRVLEPRLRSRVDAAALGRLAAGRRIVGLERRAKYLLAELDSGARLVIHLGMSGRLALRPAGEPLEPHVHVVFGLEGGVELRFRDPRRFGLVDLLDAGGLASDRRFRDLGVEPLSRACTPRSLRVRARGLRRPIKNFLMDARSIAGVGNIYASEALFLAGIHPRRAAGRLGPAAWERLARALKRVLRAAIRRGGTTINDFRDAGGAEGYFQLSLRVYDRAGKPCRRCPGTIRRSVLAGRSTFYCPRCQR